MEFHQLNPDMLGKDIFKELLRQHRTWIDEKNTADDAGLISNDSNNDGQPDNEEQ